MKELNHEAKRMLSDSIFELKGLNALIGMMQTAFAEGSGAVCTDDAPDALYHIYTTQNNILERMKQAIDED